MGDLQMILAAVVQVFTSLNLLIIFGGLILGMIVGCIPGLSVTLGIILLLPLTYSFSSPDTAIISMLAVYVGGMYGGSISAITLNTPGTNSAIATTFDGYPLAKQGKVKKGPGYVPVCFGIRRSVLCGSASAVCFLYHQTGIPVRVGGVFLHGDSGDFPDRRRQWRQPSQRNYLRPSGDPDGINRGRRSDWCYAFYLWD